MSNTATEPSVVDDDPASSARRSALVLALCCQRLDLGGARFALDDVDEIRVGRDGTLVAEPAGHRMLRIGVPDPKMSASHALFERRGTRWRLSDLGSTNGSRVNGAVVAEHGLADGDHVQLGHTFFILHDRLTPLLGRRPRADLPGLTTFEPRHAAALERLARIAPTPLPIMLLGETGSGKEVLARSIHELSRRRGPFVPVNCGAIAPTLLESQLFGHVKGAFSGAHRDEPGFVRSADRGTLFLDEVAELPAASQAALLRVLQESEVVPVGAARPLQVDLRVLSATLQPVDDRIDVGSFRSDLYARLSGFVFTVPPLRKRIEDLGLLVAAILARSRHARAEELRIRPDVGERLLRYQWPLNVRELEQTLLAAAALASDGVVRMRDLPPSLRKSVAPPAPPASLSPDDCDLRGRLLAELRAADGNLSAVARSMGKARQQIQRWVRRLAIAPAEYGR
jgi:transcriptional regulator with PAS, ATPase and Fis domain